MMNLRIQNIVNKQIELSPIPSDDARRRLMEMQNKFKLFTVAVLLGKDHLLCRPVLNDSNVSGVTGTDRTVVITEDRRSAEGWDRTYTLYPTDAQDKPVMTVDIDYMIHDERIIAALDRNGCLRGMTQKGTEKMEFFFQLPVPSSRE